MAVNASKVMKYNEFANLGSPSSVSNNAPQVSRVRPSSV